MVVKDDHLQGFTPMIRKPENKSEKILDGICKAGGRANEVRILSKAKVHNTTRYSFAYIE